ncbi:hypothetical protein [Massilia eburnea]|uniref:hypothetical protein n=1 Tax=Massilia eburnea TaxID=1776165 RepID=UPI003D6AD35A
MRGLVVQDVDTRLKPGSKDATTVGLVINDPHSYWQLRSSHEIGEHMQFDWTLRYNGSMPKPHVPSYHELDANLVWKASPHIDVALAGQNLLHARHGEWGRPPWPQCVRAARVPEIDDAILTRWQAQALVYLAYRLCWRAAGELAW